MIEKNKIKNFSIKARVQLREAVEIKLARIGIDKKEIKNELEISTPEKKYYLDESEANSLVGSEIAWRQEIVKELKKRGYDDDPETVLDDFIEEVAYTWFNRIVAIRFMEVNDYLPSRVRVLSSIEGKVEPDIINQALEVEDDLGGYSDEERELINRALLERTPDLMDKLYAMLFIKQNDELSKILPGLFVRTRDYLKLLFTPNYDRGVIKELVTDLPESYFNVDEEGQVQIIGWMYQYYNTEPHEQVVNMNGGAIKKDEIAAATQIFTPDWIVRYMVDNSIGKYYLERHSESKIAGELKYLLPDELDKISDSRDLTEYKVIDNAMGSGHILVYAFDVLMEMYQEQGYSRREAAKTIVENNIYGLELDKRAFQLAYFAIMMKGREYDRRFFTRDVKNHLYYFEDLHVTDEFYDLIPDAKAKEDLKAILADFENAAELGSIINIPKDINIAELREKVEAIVIDDALDVFGLQRMKEKVLKTLEIASTMTTKYEAVVTNPPYMNKFDPALKKYLTKHYKAYSKDLFSVFMYYNMNMLAKGGYSAYMTPLVWMFIKSYEELRLNIMNNVKIDSLIQLEYSALEEATVPIDTFVLKNSEERVGTYLRLSDFKGGMQVQDQKVREAVIDGSVDYLYYTDQSNFSKIPGSPIAYWASENIIDIFENNLAITDTFYSKKGLDTGENNRFYRLWYEVNPSVDYWKPLNKGGRYRKWYGNQEYVINWKNDGFDIKNNGKANIRNEKFYFKESITWSDVTSGKFSCRYSPKGFIFDATGPSIYGNHEDLNWLIAYLNTNVFNMLTDLTMPTIHYTNGHLGKLPYPSDSTIERKEIAHIASTNIALSKSDWDAFETSWDFQQNPLIATHAASLPEAFSIWQEQALSRFNQLKDNEEELNRIFIDLYGLQDELTPEEEDKEVSVRKADQVRDVKALLSYFIGCVFGRYSLDKPGLAFAGGEWNEEDYQSFTPNKENIIVLTDRQYFNDDRDIIVRLKDFLTQSFSQASLLDNLNFIAQTLDPKKYDKGISSEEIIRQYFISDFYKDHLKTYQKRPIYWEFNSGRTNGFKALMYLHRYDSDQLAMVRNYLHDLQPMKNRMIELNEQLLEQTSVASEKSKYRKIVTSLQKELSEMIKYDSILDNLAKQQIELDLDDGVVANHKKLDQGKKLLSKI